MIALLLTLMQLKSYVETLPDSTVQFTMVPVPGGTLGDKEVKPFFMCTTETPWEVFDTFLLSGEPSQPYDQTEFAPDAISRPSRSYILPDLGWGHQGYPVINVSHTNVEMFLRWLRSATGKNYRLPTESEWEWAARGALTGTIEESEWSMANADYTTHPIGKLKPNAFGLYDMLGNVGEWALDAQGKPVLCGGDFMHETKDLAPTIRRYWKPDWQQTDPQMPKSRWWLSDGWFVGFRIVCNAP